MTLEQMIEQGFTADQICAKLGHSYDFVMQMIEQRHELELEKQYEFMQYAEDAANADAQFYGEI
jgi:hypothetical protein